MAVLEILFFQPDASPSWSAMRTDSMVGADSVAVDVDEGFTKMLLTTGEVLVV
jgi:hypothetical protein